MNETIAQIRKARQQISEKCGYDSKRLIDFYIDRQTKEIKTAPTKPKTTPQSADNHSR